MFIDLEELVNGWVLKISNRPPEYHETKLGALTAIENYIGKEASHELTLLSEGARNEY